MRNIDNHLLVLKMEGDHKPKNALDDGQRSLGDYIPCGHKKLDMTEHAHTHRERNHPFMSLLTFILICHIQK